MDFQPLQKNLRHIMGTNFPEVTQHETGRAESQVGGSSSAEWDYHGSR